MGTPALIPIPRDGDWTTLREALARLNSRAIGPGASPTFRTLTLTELNPNEIVITNGDKQLTTTNTIDGGEET